MHNITNDANGDSEANSMTLGYQLNDNAHIGLARFTAQDESELTWLTISIGM